MVEREKVVKLKENIELYLSRFSDLGLIGEPRIKNAQTFRMFDTSTDLITAIEYLVYPKGKGIYSIKDLNNYLNSLIPEESYVKSNFIENVNCDLKGFVKFQLTDNDNKLGFGNLCFKLPYEDCNLVTLGMGEFYVPPMGDAQEIDVDNFKVAADSVGYFGMLMLYPHESLARKSYEVSKSKPPIDYISMKELRKVKKNYDPSILQMLFG